MCLVLELFPLVLLYHADFELSILKVHSGFILFIHMDHPMYQNLQLIKGNCMLITVLNG